MFNGIPFTSDLIFHLDRNVTHTELYVGTPITAVNARASG